MGAWTSFELDVGLAVGGTVLDLTSLQTGWLPGLVLSWMLDLLWEGQF